MGKSRAVEMMQMAEAQRLAISDKMQAEEFEARVQAARGLARERGLENPTLKLRVWNVVTTSHRKLGEELNRMEGEGWTLVNVLTNGTDRATIVSARVIEAPLPPEDEIMGEDGAKPGLTPDEAEAERLRAEWAETTGGIDAVAETSQEEIGGAIEGGDVNA